MEYCTLPETFNSKFANEQINGLEDEFLPQFGANMGPFLFWSVNPLRCLFQGLFQGVSSLIQVPSQSRFDQQGYHLERWNEGETPTNEVLGGVIRCEREKNLQLTWGNLRKFWE